MYLDIPNVMPKSEFPRTAPGFNGSNAILSGMAHQALDHQLLRSFELASRIFYDKGNGLMLMGEGAGIVGFFYIFFLNARQTLPSSRLFPRWLRNASYQRLRVFRTGNR